MLLRFSKILTFFFACFVFIGCSLDAIEDQANSNETDILAYIKIRNLTLQKSPDGIYYQITTPSTSTKVKSVGDLLTYHYKMTLLDGTLVDSTNRDKGISRSEVLGVAGSTNVFTLPLSLLKEGERGLFLIPSALAFSGSSFGAVPAFSVIRLELSLDAVRDQASQIELIKQTYSIQNPEVTSTGLVFKKLVENPTGALVSSNAPVLINYIGRLAYSYVHSDASYNAIFGSGTLGTPTMPFILSQNNLIPGFTEALSKMRVGEKVAAIIPYTLGYGTAGNTSIPGYAPLYFEITVVAP